MGAGTSLPSIDKQELAKDASLIIKDIADNVKNSKFIGITLIVCPPWEGPVDCLTSAYQGITEYTPDDVISFGCSLRTCQLKGLLGKQWGVDDIGKIDDAYALGECFCLFFVVVRGGDGCAEVGWLWGSMGRMTTSDHSFFQWFPPQYANLSTF